MTSSLSVDRVIWSFRIWLTFLIAFLEIVWCSILKCVFKVSSSKLLGFFVSHQGIEANSRNFLTIELMCHATCIQQLQRLTKFMEVLSHFISKLEEQGLLFVQLLHGSSPFWWTIEAEQALQGPNEYLISPIVMVALEQGEPLLFYITTNFDIVSMVLVIEC